MARPRTGNVRGWFGDRSALENRLLVALAVDAVVFVLVGVFSGVSASFILTLAVLNLLLVPPWSTLEVGGRRIGRLVQPVGLITLALTYPFYVGKEFQIPIFGAFPDVATGVVMLVFIMMAIGLNIVVGYAGLLDLGYVAFYAIGAYTVAWFASVQFAKHNVHFLSVGVGPGVPGFHISIWLLLPAAGIITALAGVLIGLPTLRLRGDYLAIVTLGFGEILPQIARNGDSLFNTGFNLTNGPNGITPIDAPGFFGVNYLVGSGTFWTSDRLFYWTALALVLITAFCSWRLRDSRLGRAWVALREDEVAAVSMGIPAVKTKLLAYSIGAAFGGLSGAFLGSFHTVVSGDDFQFGFSVFILSMVIIGGLGSVWGAVAGGLLLGYINYYLIPDVLNTLPSTFGLHFQLTEIEFGIYGFLLVLVMVLRPQGLLPERRRRLELTEAVASSETMLEESA